MSLRAFSRELSSLVSQVVPCLVALRGRQGDAVVLGSGFLIGRDGYAVTNHHVVEETEPGIVVTLHGGATTNAAVVGVDPVTDLALIRLEQSPRSFLRLRKQPVRLGELCLALGSPLGEFPESVSLGLVSGVGRTVPQDASRPMFCAVQTDCAINLGNSGGPLVDVEGQVIGVNTLMRIDAAGIGFAIPAATVQSVIGELKTHGRVRRASLGVSVKKVLAQVGGKAVAGLEITSVSKPKSVGLQRGDIILKIAGTRVREQHQIFTLLTGDHIGQATPVDVVRHGAPHRVVVEPREL